MIIKWYHYEKQYKVSQKIKIELPYDPATPLLGTYPKKIENRILKRYSHINIHYNIIHIVKIWKHPKCSLTNEWVKKTCIDMQWNIIQSK